MTSSTHALDHITTYMDNKEADSSPACQKTTSVMHFDGTRGSTTTRHSHMRWISTSSQKVTRKKKKTGGIFREQQDVDGNAVAERLHSGCREEVI